MVEILPKSIQAERLGNFHIHLQTIKDMLPYFAAAGHHLYIKSTQMYLQSMSKLETTHPKIPEKFIKAIKLSVEVTGTGEVFQQIW